MKVALKHSHCRGQLNFEDWVHYIQPTFKIAAAFWFQVKNLKDFFGQKCPSCHSHVKDSPPKGIFALHPVKSFANGTVLLGSWNSWALDSYWNPLIGQFWAISLGQSNWIWRGNSGANASTIHEQMQSNWRANEYKIELQYLQDSIFKKPQSRADPNPNTNTREGSQSGSKYKFWSFAASEGLPWLSR